mmetsp:Transcript_105836/g.194100  ORF Transcript_105836/g.194100 Transcript_105836/m.194100 type:complete len:206 (+) Transcript_105836:961-1578(+)
MAQTSTLQKSPTSRWTTSGAMYCGVPTKSPDVMLLLCLYPPRPKSMILQSGLFFCRHSREHDILKLEVPVNNASTVTISNRNEHLADKSRYEAFAHFPALFYQADTSITRYVLKDHHQLICSSVLRELVQLHDVRMVKSAQHIDLSLKPFDHRLVQSVRGHRLAHPLLSALFCIARACVADQGNAAEASVAKLLDHLVVPQQVVA